MYREPFQFRYFHFSTGGLHDKDWSINLGVIGVTFCDIYVYSAETNAFVHAPFRLIKSRFWR